MYGASVTTGGVGCTQSGSSSVVGAPDSVKAQMDKASGSSNSCYLYVGFGGSVTSVTGWNIYATEKTCDDPWVAAYARRTSDQVWVTLRATATWSGNYGGSVATTDYDQMIFEMAGHANACTFKVDAVSLTGTAPATPTPTNTPTPTFTPSQTPTPTGYPTGPGEFPSLNHLINRDFNIAPNAFGYGWEDINRVVQAPVLGSGEPIENLENGSCGQWYWVMSTPLGAAEGGEIFQDFDWLGGQMFINLEGMTNSYATRGQVTITNKNTGQAEALPEFTNGSFSWQSFKWVTESKPAGSYRFSVDYEGAPGGVTNRPAVAIDNVNLRRGYWGNDCPPGDYDGQIPTNQRGTATPIVQASATPFPSNFNRLNNCGFEQGWSAWAHNAGARQFMTGGATGPTYAYLHTLYDNGSDAEAVDVPGHIWQPFNWEGGRMYVTYFTGPGTRVATSIRNLFSGAVYEMQSAGTVQSYSGWSKRSYSFAVSDPGQYVIDARSPNGQIAALDGFTVAAGGFASGPCANMNTSGENNSTATAHATSSQIAATTQPAAQQTAYAVQTTQAAAFDDYLTQQYGTMTQNAAATQTALPPQQTATRAAQQTATAQGTPVPSVTPTPNATQVCQLSPTLPPCWVVPPVTVVHSPATLTAIANAANATGTAQAVAAETQFAAIIQTAAAKAQQTQNAAQTQTAAPLVLMTQQAAILQTATARAMQTSTAQAQLQANQTATAQALATQSQQQAQATQTAAALQTALAAATNAATEAAATSTAQAYATTYAGVTSTAQAQQTQSALATTAAQSNLPPVDERPEPQPNADCIRPSSPLQIANWIDYEVCRVLTWFAWSPDNTAQMQGLTQMCEDRYPCGLMLEVREVFDVFIAWAQSIPCAGGFCGDEPLTEFNITARGILLGEFDFSDAGPSYGTECDLLLAPIVGPAIQTGACFCLNVMCALGILPWTQLIWNIVMAFLLALYVQRTWFSAAHT